MPSAGQPRVRALLSPARSEKSAVGFSQQGPGPQGGACVPSLTTAKNMGLKAQGADGGTAQAPGVLPVSPRTGMKPQLYLLTCLDAGAGGVQGPTPPPRQPGQPEGQPSQSVSTCPAPSTCSTCGRSPERPPASRLPSLPLPAPAPWPITSHHHPSPHSGTPRVHSLGLTPTQGDSQGGRSSSSPG